MRHSQDATQPDARQQRQIDTVERGTEYEYHVIDNERPRDGDGQRLLALLELPPVRTGRAVPKIDALMLEQVTR
ncbi:MAG TPA: hypothetical protein VES20_16460 [Bryobacteraceae bacterium]|nr:hypothetical protein [Bryobacteraceae bacterium]